MAKLDWNKVKSLFKNYKERLIAIYNKSQADKDELIGLDIGSDSVKLLRVDTTTSPYLIKHFGIVSLPHESIIKDEIKNPTAISHALKDLIAQSGSSIKNVGISIPRSLAIIKTILINAGLSDEEIESRAWIEAQRHFPDLIGDIYLDFVITNTGIKGQRFDDPLQSEMVLVAGRKEQLKPYLEIVQNAGLIPRLVDVNCYALERSLSLMKEQTKAYETVALLNLNTNLSSLIVTHKGKMIHAHDETFDGQHLLNEIKDYLQERNSSSLLSSSPLSEDELYNTILRNNLISHLRHIVQFIYSSHTDINIELIVLSGDCASIPGLAKFTQNEIGTPSLIADPFANMQFGQTIDQISLREHAPGMMLCTGLAVSELIIRDDTTEQVKNQ